MSKAKGKQMLSILYVDRCNVGVSSGYGDKLTYFVQAHCFVSLSSHPQPFY